MMNLRLMIVCLTTITMVTFVSKSDAKLVKGHLQTDKNWYHLTDFCEQTNQLSGFYYNFMYPVSYGTQKLLLYYDDQWFSVIDKNCNEKLSVLKPENHQIIALNTSYTLTSRYSGCSVEQKMGENFYNCTGSRDFASARPRCWYIAIARCSPAQGNVNGLQLTYTMDVPSMRDQGTRKSISASITIIVAMGCWLLSV